MRLVTRFAALASNRGRTRHGNGHVAPAMAILTRGHIRVATPIYFIVVAVDAFIVVEVTATRHRNSCFFERGEPSYESRTAARQFGRLYTL